MRGNIYLFVLFNSEILYLHNIILENINIYSLFFIVESQKVALEKTLIRNNYFYYLWERNTDCTNVINNQSEYYNNTIAISIYRDLAIYDAFLSFYKTFIHSNSFTQKIPGGMIQMQLGACTLNETYFIDNYFLSPDTFQFVFEFDEYCHLMITKTYFLNNGIIMKKKSYYAFNDNDIFSL